jgi:hypothetical protein
LAGTQAAIEEKKLKQFRIVALAAAACALVAAPALASTTSSYSGLNVSITGGKDVDLSRGITSITLSSPTTLDYSAPRTTLADLLGALGGLIKTGPPIKIGDFGGGILPIRPGYPPTHPIPEGRAAVLYGVGLCLVGWVVFRFRRAQHSS